MPSPAAVFECQQKRKQRGELLRSDYKRSPLQAARRQGSNQSAADKLFQEVTELEQTWFPPPHKSKWTTPIPACFFEMAKCKCPVKVPCKCLGHAVSCSKWVKCKCTPWDIRERYKVDLLPTVNNALVQNGPSQDWLCIQSQDARACLSLCRPLSNFVSKRKLHKRGPAQNVAIHQSGEIMLRSVTHDQDQARGMLGGIQCTPEYLQNQFVLRDSESAVLPSLIAWLQTHNPWMAAYCTSASECNSVREFVKELNDEGRILASMPPDLVEGQLREQLGKEPVAVFQPVDDLNYSVGSGHHLRVAAAKICRMKLTRPLPAEWNTLHESEFIGSDGEPVSKYPETLWWNKSFTGMSVP